MPPKRKAADESGPAKKKAATLTGPKLKKSKAPNWDDESEFSSEKPTGEWAKKCVDRWCLLPPYNPSISEEQWEDYYTERSALDDINSSGAEKELVSEEELGHNPWEILRKAAGNLAAIVLGSKLADEERKKQIARTLMGSLYFTELWGNDDDGSPRDIDAKTRLYSPFGAGASIDLYYRYHLRARMFSNGERFSSLYAKSRMGIEIDPENPTACSATKRNANGVLKAASDAVTVFDRNGSKSKGTTPANIKSFEETLFCTEGWISPLKLVEILFAAGTVMHYNEGDKSSPKAVLAKFSYFDGETNGASLLTAELKSLAALEAKEPADQTVVSIPRRLLLLARQDGTSESEQGSGQ